MKIGFDAKRAFQNKSGLGNYSRDVIRLLYDNFPMYKYIMFSPDQETSLLQDKYIKNIISPKAKSKAGKTYWRTFSMTKDIIESKIDIYHGLSNELPFGINKSSVKKIVTIHDLIFLEIPQLYPLIDRKLYHKKFLHACQVADKIVATSEHTKKDIIKHFGIKDDKIEVIYQTCNKIFAKKTSVEDTKKILSKYGLKNDYILNVGTLETRKNALNIIKAVYYYNIKTDVVFVGRKTAYYKELKAYINEHNMNNRIHFLSNVSNEELPAIYQNCRLFIYPSLYEGFGIPILEAFRSGVPVITSNIGSPAEIAGNAAIQVDPLNSKHIGIAIKSIVDSSDLAQNLIKEGTQRFKLFDSEQVSTNIIKFYQSL
ncbi:MAG: glycosyltransferase family 1 protein [Bacteroidales bacterium]|nr:glycosyltransferase family 1 protein [Bacteroidales bacterium]